MASQFDTVMQAGWWNAVNGWHAEAVTVRNVTTTPPTDTAARAVRLDPEDGPSRSNRMVFVFNKALTTVSRGWEVVHGGRAWKVQELVDADGFLEARCTAPELEG